MMWAGVVISGEQRERLAVWAASHAAAETLGQVLDPGAWAHAEFVVSRNRARLKAQALLDRMLEAVR